MSEAFINDSFKVAEDVANISHDLSRLSNAAKTIGLENLGDNLSDLSFELLTASQKIRDIVGTKTSEDLNEAHRGNAAIMTALIGIGKANV